VAPTTKTFVCVGQEDPATNRSRSAQTSDTSVAGRSSAAAEQANEWARIGSIAVDIASAGTAVRRVSHERASQWLRRIACVQIRMGRTGQDPNEGGEVAQNLTTSRYHRQSRCAPRVANNLPHRNQTPAAPLCLRVRPKMRHRPTNGGVSRAHLQRARHSRSQIRRVLGTRVRLLYRLRRSNQIDVVDEHAHQGRRIWYVRRKA
jgi:hypothetical protein